MSSYTDRMEFLRGVIADNPNITREELTKIAMKHFNVKRYRISSLVTALKIYPKRHRTPKAPPSSKDGYKICVKCEKELPIDMFPTKKRRKGRIEVYAYCKECHNTYQKESRIFRIFGITIKEKDMLGDKCMICGFSPKTRANALDHDHKTGLIRGILCSRCNRGITWFQDNPEFLLSASNYLKNPPAEVIWGEKKFTKKGSIKNKRKRKTYPHRSLIDK